MTITLTDLRYANAEQTSINLMVAYDTGGSFPYDGTPIPFTYVPEDGAPFTLAIKDELTKNAYTIAAYEPPTTTFVPTGAKGQSSVIED